MYEGEVFLLAFFDGHGTVEGHVLFAEVAEVAVVGGCGELRSSYAVLDEVIVNAVHAVVTKTDIDLVGTGVVVGPAGEHIVLVGVALHYLCDSAEYVAVFAGEVVAADRIVDSGERSCFHFLDFNGTVEAVAELLLEVGDAGIGGGETGAEGVAVFSRGAYGHYGVLPFALVEEIGEAEISLNVEVGAVLTLLVVGYTVDGGSAEIERELNLLAYVERVDDTGTEGEYFVAGVLVAVVLAVLIFLGESPIAACTAVEYEVVDAVGLVAAEEVGEVCHYVEYRAYVVVTGLVVAVGTIFVEKDGACVLVAEALVGKEVHADTGTPDGSEPLTYVECGVGSETILEIAMYVILREVDIDAALSGDEPVILERVHQVTLRCVFNVLDFLSLLGKQRGCHKQGAHAGEECNLLHRSLQFSYD